MALDHDRSGRPLRARRPAGAQSAGWFEGSSRGRAAYGLLVFAAAGYSLVSHLLARANALPMPDPFLRIPASAFFYWGTFFYGPVILAAWLLATGFVYLLVRASRGGVDFGVLLRATAFATGLSTLGTLIPDLVTSPLRATGVIDERGWEESIRGHGAWFVFTWVTLVAYAAAFLVTYPIAVRRATGLAWPKAIAIGVVGFVVFQGFEFVFIR